MMQATPLYCYLVILSYVMINLMSISYKALVGLGLNSVSFLYGWGHSQPEINVHKQVAEMTSIITDPHENKITLIKQSISLRNFDLSITVIEALCETNAKKDLQDEPEWLSATIFCFNLSVHEYQLERVNFTEVAEKQVWHAKNDG